MRDFSEAFVMTIDFQATTMITSHHSTMDVEVEDSTRETIFVTIAMAINNLAAAAGFTALSLIINKMMILEIAAGIVL